MAALVNDDRIYETSTTTGTGAYALAGAATGFQPFSVIGAANYCYYVATDDVNWELGIGTYSATPDTLTRTAVLSSSNGDAAVDWAAGTRKIRCGELASRAQPTILSKSVAGSSNVTLTASEQRRRVLVLTGVLTGNIDVIVDTTVWDWIVYNNTTGAYTLTLKVSGQTGVKVPQGQRTALHCDGTDVRHSDNGSLVLLKTQVASGASAVDFTTYIDSTYDNYVLKLSDVVPGTDAVNLLMRVSQDGGSTYLSTNEYNHTRNINISSGNTAAGADAAASIVLAAGIGNASGETIGGTIEISAPAGSGSLYKQIGWDLSGFDANPLTNRITGAATVKSGSAINAIRILTSSGTFSGNFSLYGVRK
jgi:hypothetical protein